MMKLAYRFKEKNQDFKGLEAYKKSPNEAALSGSRVFNRIIKALFGTSFLAFVFSSSISASLPAAAIPIGPLIIA
jgi:hypothetical protein